MTIEELTELCRANGLEVPAEQAQLLKLYSELLLEWNQKINLISRKDEQNVLERHILHSLVLCMPSICDYNFTGKRVSDIGTGGGLPGIPLRIVSPETFAALIDSIQKKIIADSDMISRLRLQNISALCGRVEELAKLEEHRARYDVVVSRAVAPLEDLIRWGRGLLKPHGTLFSLKGGDLDEEINRAMRLPDVEHIDVRQLALTGYQEFVLEEKKLVRVELKSDQKPKP